MVTLDDFLEQIITSPFNTQHTQMQILVRGRDIEYINYPDDIPLLVSLSGEQDVYFSPHLYAVSEQPGVNGHILLATRTVALDLNNTDLIYLSATPSVVVSTSPDRNQAYFVFDETIDESIGKQIAASAEEVDAASIALGYLFRLPNTINTKYQEPHKVTIVRNTPHINKVDQLVPSHTKHTHVDTDFEIPTLKDLRPQRYVEELNLPPIVNSEFSATLPLKQQQSSLRRFIKECLLLGVPKGVVFLLCQHHANNYTKQLKYHQDEELKKLINFVDINKNKQDVKGEVYKIRSTTQTIEARRDGIATLTIQYMREHGTFSHMRDGVLLYTPEAAQPLFIGSREQSLLTYLERVFGLNATDGDTPHVIASLTSFSQSLPRNAESSILSYYDRHTNRLLVSTGAAELYNITPQAITLVSNGISNITLFPMNNISIPFLPRPKALPQHWSEMLFGPVLDSILTLSHEEARAILASWFLFILFKNDAGARPLLAMLGQPGSGKSTIMKRVCTLLYGKVSGFMTIGTKDEYDQVTSTYPLVVIDNLDTWQSWIPDALAQSASAIDRGVRKMYTNHELHIYHRDAIVAITAHDPKFSRPDVADRLIILPMQRIEEGKFIAERDLMRMDRPAMWYHIFLDLQKILGTPQPPTSQQLRVQDFVSLGSWIASGLDLLDEFTSAITKLKGSQKAFALSGDQLLLNAMIAYTTKPARGRNTASTYQLPQQLYLALEYASGDGDTFRKKYKNAQALDNKLWASQDALRSVVDISWDTDSFGRRTWKIGKKDPPTDNL